MNGLLLLILLSRSWQGWKRVITSYISENRIITCLNVYLESRIHFTVCLQNEWKAWIQFAQNLIFYLKTKAPWDHHFEVRTSDMNTNKLTTQYLKSRHPQHSFVSWSYCRAAFQAISSFEFSSLDQKPSAGTRDNSRCPKEASARIWSFALHIILCDQVHKQLVWEYGTRTIFLG